MTTKFNVGDKVYVEEGFEIKFYEIRKIEITKLGVYYFFRGLEDIECDTISEFQIHKTEKEAYCSILERLLRKCTYHSIYNVQIDKLQQELLEVIARYKD